MPETTTISVTVIASEATTTVASETTASETTTITIAEVHMLEDTLDDKNDIENFESENVIDEHFANKETDLNWPLYSLQEVNEGKLGNKIVFNSINYQSTDYQWHKDHYGTEIPTGTILDEFDFVGARENISANNVWNGDRIKIEEGKDYIIRLYVHNNNPNGEDAIAENTYVSFNTPSPFAHTVAVNGYIYSNSAFVNGYPYMDNVIFESATGEIFHL